MNQVDKELMQEKGILTENEKADEYEIQKAAMKEAVFFLAAMLEKNLDMSELQTISLYLKELSMKQHYMHIHLYVQQLYRNSRPHEELETFYIQVFRLLLTIIFKGYCPKSSGNTTSFLSIRCYHYHSMVIYFGSLETGFASFFGTNSFRIPCLYSPLMSS